MKPPPSLITVSGGGEPSGKGGKSEGTNNCAVTEELLAITGVARFLS